MRRISEIPSRSGWLRWIHEYLFSLNLAWAIVWYERETTKVLGGHVLADLVAAFVWRAAPLVGERSVLEQLVWSFAVALIGLLLLRIVSRFHIIDDVLRIVSGAAAIVAFPFATRLWTGFFEPYYRTKVNIELFLEVIVILLCGLLFYLRKPQISISLMLVVLLFHFGLWAWVTSSYLNIPAFASDLRLSASSLPYYRPWIGRVEATALWTVFQFGFPVIGLMAGATWAVYISRSSDRPRKTSSP